MAQIDGQLLLPWLLRIMVALSGGKVQIPFNVQVGSVRTTVVGEWDPKTGSIRTYGESAGEGGGR